MKEEIIEMLKDSLYSDYPITIAEANLDAINNKDQLVEIRDSIDIVELFLNGSLNEE